MANFNRGPAYYLFPRSASTIGALAILGVGLMIGLRGSSAQSNELSSSGYHGRYTTAQLSNLYPYQGALVIDSMNSRFELELVSKANTKAGEVALSEDGGATWDVEAQDGGEVLAADFASPDVAKEVAPSSEPFFDTVSDSHGTVDLTLNQVNWNGSVLQVNAVSGPMDLSGGYRTQWTVGETGPYVTIYANQSGHGQLEDLGIDPPSPQTLPNTGLVKP